MTVTRRTSRRCTRSPTTPGMSQQIDGRLRGLIVDCMFAAFLRGRGLERTTGVALIGSETGICRCCRSAIRICRFAGESSQVCLVGRGIMSGKCVFTGAAVCSQVESSPDRFAGFSSRVDGGALDQSRCFGLRFTWVNSAPSLPRRFRPYSIAIEDEGCLRPAPGCVGSSERNYR